MYTDVLLIWLNFYTCIRLHYLAEVWISLLSVYHFERKVTCNNFLQMLHILVETCWTSSAMQTAMLYRQYFHNYSQEPKGHLKQAIKKSTTIISIITTHHFNRMTYRLTLWCPMVFEGRIKPAKIDWMKLSKRCSPVRWNNLDLNQTGF